MPTQIIQWFPGHMAKTRRLIEENLKEVDIVIEILDARIPKSSKNPEIERLIKGKKKLVLLNKSSLANETETKKWVRFYEECGENVLSVDCITGFNTDKIVPKIRDILSELLKKYESKNMNRRLRAMVLGIPNVGKSSFINKMCNIKKTQVENRPGVTKTKQWVRAGDELELLDMPGVLWPKFDDRIVGENLAITNAIKDTVLLTEEIALALCTRLKEYAKTEFISRYKLTLDDLDLDDYDLFLLIGKKRGLLVSGGEIDEARCASMLLDEYRQGKIGRISLEIC